MRDRMEVALREMEVALREVKAIITRHMAENAELRNRNAELRNRADAAAEALAAREAEIKRLREVDEKTPF